MAMIGLSCILSSTARYQFLHFTYLRRDASICREDCYRKILNIHCIGTIVSRLLVIFIACSCGSFTVHRKISQHLLRYNRQHSSVFTILSTLETIRVLVCNGNRSSLCRNRNVIQHMQHCLRSSHCVASTT